MALDKERLNRIFQKTDGHCHLCHNKLSYNYYGKNSENGSWHIEHSIPKAKGGTDHLNNLFPACIKCNLEKGLYHTKTVRKWNNQKRAPFSAEKKRKIKTNRTIGGGAIGASIGLAVGGPLGAFFGGLAGGIFGSNSSPKK